MTVLGVSAIIVALVQAVKFLRDKDYDSFLTIVIAAALGALFGLLAVAGLDWVTGMYAGLVAVGVITTASKVAGSK